MMLINCRKTERKSNYKKCDTCNERFKCWTADHPVNDTLIIDELSLSSNDGILVSKSFAPISMRSGDTVEITFNLTFDGENLK